MALAPQSVVSVKDAEAPAAKAETAKPENPGNPKAIKKELHVSPPKPDQEKFRKDLGKIGQA
eukprot:13491012-Alexandrium_andersonii.AAC.2